METEKLKPTFYITTAIDYSNAVPHLGHALEKIGADVIARHHRFLGEDVFFSVGTDEHSQNVKRMAEKEGIEPKAYCDIMADKFKKVWEVLQVNYDRFVQTTEEIHAQTVSEIVQRIYDADDIYKGNYEGKYCGSCERFLDSGDIDEEGNCKVHGIVAELIKEENYFFRLKNYQDALLTHIKKNPKFIQPETRRNEILGLMDQGLEDISISRQTTTWGIPLPFDKKSVVYVWVDALINYFSALGGLHTDKYEHYWPADLHVIGKDITRFHCVIWPCMLMSANLPLPDQVWGHGFVHYKGAKMSKTKGTGLNPIELANSYGSDSLRYYLLREIPWDKDGDFSEKRLIERHNSELSNGIGNLVSRIHGMITKYFDGQLPVPDQRSSSQILRGSIQKKFESYLTHMSEQELTQALEVSNEMVHDINTYIADRKPWVMAKDPELKTELASLMAECLTCTLLTCIGLHPFCPDKMSDIFEAFGNKIGDFNTKDQSNSLFDTPIFVAKTPFSPIFPRFELES